MTAAMRQHVSHRCVLLITPLPAQQPTRSRQLAKPVLMKRYKVIYALLWNSIALALNHFKHVYHPGVDVAFDLIGWLLAAGTVWYLIRWLARLSPYRCPADSGECQSPEVGYTVAALIGVICVLASLWVLLCQRSRLLEH